MKNHTLLFFVIFVSSLALGYSISTRFYHPDLDIFPGAMQVAAAESVNSINTLDNGQRSILLINVTSLNADSPHLSSMWLATYFPRDTTIRLLPILPAGTQQLSIFEQRLINTFSLEKNNKVQVLSQEFISILKNDNYWWSGYIIFDDVALSQLFTLMGGIELDGRNLTSEDEVKEFLGIEDSSPTDNSSQFGLLQSACHKFQELVPNTDLAQFISHLPAHISTDLDSDQLNAEFQALFSSERKPTCRFPTLEISQVLQ